MKVDINERAFEDAIYFGLAAAGLVLVDEIVKITPRDEERMPVPIDRKDGKVPKRSGERKPVQQFGHWYQGITGNLKQAIAHEVVAGNKVMVGISSVGEAPIYGGYLENEFGTPRKNARPFLRPTINDPKVQQLLHDTFEKAFFERLSRYNK